VVVDGLRTPRKLSKPLDKLLTQRFVLTVRTFLRPVCAQRQCSHPAPHNRECRELQEVIDWRDTTLRPSPKTTKNKKDQSTRSHEHRSDTFRRDRQGYGSVSWDDLGNVGPARFVAGHGDCRRRGKVQHSSAGATKQTPNTRCRVCVLQAMGYTTVHDGSMRRRQGGRWTEGRCRGFSASHLES
jgi:hypothetical protein